MTEAPASGRSSPLLAAVASALLPGLGQLLNGERAKGWSLVGMTAGMMLSYALITSVISRLFLSLAYALVWFPTVADAYQTAAGRPRTFAGSRPGYIILMLALVGPFALTLLWASPHFSRRAKILWTVLVCAIALVFILTLGPLGRHLEQSLGDLQSQLR